MRWLKRLGRLFVILTDEDRALDSALIESIVLIHLSEEPHVASAISACHARFPNATITVFSVDEATSKIVSSPWLTNVQLPARNYGNFLIAELRTRRDARRAALVLLSLHPLTVMLTCLWFRARRLLFNRWGQWFMIRTRTLLEVLTVRPGADRPRGERRRWSPPKTQRPPVRIQGAGEILNGFAAAFPAFPFIRDRLFRSIVIVWRWLSLATYVGSALFVLGCRRWAYRLWVAVMDPPRESIMRANGLCSAYAASGRDRSNPAAMQTDAHREAIDAGSPPITGSISQAPSYQGGDR